MYSAAVKLDKLITNPLTIGACRPGHARGLPGLFRSIAYSYRKDWTRRRAACPQTSVSVLTHVQTYV